MSSGLLQKHSLELYHNSTKLPDIKIIKSNKIILTSGISLKIIKYKNEIHKLGNTNLWNYCKKLSNQFEMIYLKLKNTNNNIGVANYDPISRSYFKMWEIVKDFNVIDFKEPHLRILGLAEGPGGFMECIYNMRNKYSINYKDKITCITLKSYKNEIPGWKKSARLFKDNVCEIFYGEDGTGNIYNVNNILSLKNNFEKMDIVTGDGGFDFSKNYNNQEQDAYRIIFCEIVCALGCLKLGGKFILKIYDIYTLFTKKIIFFLTQLFNKVIITKPFTSRPANSEKYIYCENFKGISDNYFYKLLEVVEEWHNLKENENIIDIFNQDLPNEFLNAIENYSIYIGSKQLKNLIKTLSYIDLELNNTNINIIKQKQAILCCLWCKKYDYEVNLKCKYLYNNLKQYNYIPNFVTYKSR